MINIKELRKNPQVFIDSLANRGWLDAKDCIDTLISIDIVRRESIQRHEDLLRQRGVLTKKIQNATGDDKDTLLASMQNLKFKITQEGELRAKWEKSLSEKLLMIPNTLHPDTILGNENYTKEYPKDSPPKPNFTFTPKEHFDIESVKTCLDFKIASKLSGSRFSMLFGDLATINRALTQYMMHFWERHSFTEVNVPVIVNEKAMIGTGQLPKFHKDLYKTIDDQWLIPTAEVPLTNIFADTMNSYEDFTQCKQFFAHSLCFRKEAGSAGKDTKGLFRQHQFEKVEVVVVATEKYTKEIDPISDINYCVEKLLTSLNIPYRIVPLCSGDLGFSARRTVDIEVWLPGQDQYREISSISDCGDFQARRMNARVKNDKGGIEYLHTFNGSGVAVGRALIAMLENGQQEDGSVILPEVIGHHLGGRTKLSAEGKLEYDV